MSDTKRPFVIAIPIYQGVDLLDAAVGMLGPGFPPVHLLGEAAAPHGGMFEAANLVMHGRVERAEVDGWMRRATVYVAPSRYEPFGLAPLEAALAGCALVLSDIATFRELWDGCAEFFAPGDPAALAEVRRRATPRGRRRWRSGRRGARFVATRRADGASTWLLPRVRAALAEASVS